eukprot:TRINITY_DN775931_c0_g1_i1.p1 TRINITY_DN775931_c0_g1~~TRINITY_DN775931_c0_g1_i1.p1  ORF type:complete len:141 (-),score=14.47 TRINITY_DN775931_c0_g1_i1:154-576(-)
MDVHRKFEFSKALDQCLADAGEEIRRKDIGKMLRSGNIVISQLMSAKIVEYLIINLRNKFAENIPRTGIIEECDKLDESYRAAAEPDRAERAELLTAIKYKSSYLAALQEHLGELEDLSSEFFESLNECTNEISNEDKME